MAQWADLYSGQELGTDVHLGAETQVRKLEEELRLEKDMQLSTTLLALGPGTRWVSRLSWRTYHAFNKAKKAPAAMDEGSRAYDKA